MKRIPIPVLLITLHSSLFTTVPACDKSAAKEEAQAAKDTQAPSLSITEPSLPYGMEGISQKEGVITFSGMAEDDRGVVRVKWENHRGGKGWATVVRRGTQTDWEVKDIPVEPGDNRITLTAQDAAANAATQTIWVVRTTDVDFISYPDASETDLEISKLTEVIFRVAIKESPKVKIESVKLVKVNENGEILDTLGEMLDDGKSEHGDEVPADGVFSAKVTLLEGTEGKVRFRVVVSGVKEGAGGVTASSEPFAARVFRPWTMEQLNAFWAVQEPSEKMYFDLKSRLGHEEAARRTVEWVKQQPGVARAHADEDGYGFTMEWGEFGGHIDIIPRGSGWHPDDPPETRGETPGPSRQLRPQDQTPIQAPPLPEKAPQKRQPLRYKFRVGARAELKNPKVLLVSPFSKSLPTEGLDFLQKKFEASKCPTFLTKRIENLDADIEAFKTFKDYNVVVLYTHGNALCRTGDGPAYEYRRCPCGRTAGAMPVTLTSIPRSQEMDVRYLDERNGGRIVGKPLDVYGITPAFVTKYDRSFPTGALVFNGSCRSLFNPALSDSYRSAGAAAYLGYTEYVSIGHHNLVVNAFFEFLLTGRNLTQALGDTLLQRGLKDPAGGFNGCEPAAFVGAGKQDLKITIEGFNNGSFEQGPGVPPAGWDATGDVQIITKLGPLTAKDGSYMAYLSTGENAEDQSKSTLEQPFCVPADKSKISFSYRLVSEEPLEFVNSEWRDTFEAALVVGTARTVLVSETTDKGPWAALSGVDLEGGDRTAFTTDWRRISSDLPETARTEGATLAFRLQDNGDLVYDTAALLDNVHLE
ncbi:MAG: hypothetical protein HYT87_20300 [Nitrospirae bacterium]|nr:hypothetical protein [Nitrospirota bacterium]